MIAAMAAVVDDDVEAMAPRGLDQPSQHARIALRTLEHTDALLADVLGKVVQPEDLAAGEIIPPHAQRSATGLWILVSADADLQQPDGLAAQRRKVLVIVLRIAVAVILVGAMQQRQA